MAQAIENPRLDDVIEAVEALPAEDQAVLTEVIRLRLAEKERARVVADVGEARVAHREGSVRRGSASDFLAEVGE